MKIKKQKGYTLIELLLYLGVVVLIISGIYSFYNKVQTNIKATNLSNNLRMIDNQIAATYNILGGFTTLTNANIIAANIPPKEMVVDANNIQNTLGGALTFGTATVGSVAGYSITLTKLSSYACNKLATLDFASIVQEVAINGTTVKVANGPLTPAQIATTASKCATSESNTLIYRNILLTANLDATGTTSVTRNKETAYNIPTIGNPSAGISPSCAGGATWNNSFCSCPAGTEWNGSSCVTFGTTTQPGWCQRGQGWASDSKVCAALPHGTSSNTYAGGRNLPGSVTTTPAETIAVGKTIPAANSEVVGGRTITSPIGVTTDTNVQVCVNGSWDASVLRCVTP